MCASLFAAGSIVLASAMSNPLIASAADGASSAANAKITTGRCFFAVNISSFLSTRQISENT